jgi:hypothetical protein
VIIVTHILAQSALLLETLKIVRLIKHEIGELAGLEALNFKITDYKYPSLSRESITGIYLSIYLFYFIIIANDSYNLLLFLRY